MDNGPLIHREESYQDVYLVQKYLLDEDRKKKLVFGPLTTTLGDLYDDDWYLSASYTKYQLSFHRKTKIHITKDIDDGYRVERYKLGTINTMIVNSCTNMVPILHSVMNVNFGRSYIDRSEDPFKRIFDKYPRSYDDAEMMIGNQTLSEYLDETTKRKSILEELK